MLRKTKKNSARVLATVVAFSITAWIVALNAYYQVFSWFAEYDDEGYVLISLKLFRQGRALYDTVFSQYGPFYFAFMDAVLSALRINVSHDAGRFIQVGIWTATSLVCGLLIFGLTRNLAIGCAVQLLTALALDTIRNESMHPGALICFVLSCIALVTLLIPHRPRVAWASLGALGAALALTKINVGIFALLAIGFVAIPARRILLTIAGVVVICTPALLMMSRIDEPSVQRFIFHITAALLPLVVLGVGQVFQPAPRAVAWALGGAAAATVLISAFALLHGTTLQSLWNAVLIAPQRHPAVMFRPLVMGPASRKFALIAAIAGVVIVSRKRIDAPLLRIAAALAMWMAVPGILPTRLGFYFAPIAWVAALPVASIPDSQALAFARRFLPLLAVLQTLHAYPVSRSQIQWGAFLLVPVAAICIFDGVRLLSIRWAPANAIASALLLLLVAVPVVKTITAARRDYVTNVPLALPGSQHVRLPSAQVSQLRDVVRMLDDHDCRTFIGAPGMGSFYFWARREPPTALNINGWGYLFVPELQQRAVHDLEHVDWLCVVERGGVLATWPAVHKSILAVYLQRNFVPVAENTKYRLWIHR